MKRLLLILLCLALLFNSCKEENPAITNDESNSTTGAIFRDIYDQTYWYSIDAPDIIFKFSTQNLVSIIDLSDTSCFTYEAGTYNVNSNGCFYQGISLSIVNEESNTLAYRESIPNGTALPGSPQNCENANGTILLFEVISNNKIKLSFTDFDNNLIEWDLFISNQTFSTNNCFDGIQEGIFFEEWKKYKIYRKAEKRIVIE